jgi:hypothetical protein
MNESGNSGGTGGEVKQLISFTVRSGGIWTGAITGEGSHPFTWLPKACVKGIINLRGGVIPIVDLRQRR